MDNPNITMVGVWDTVGSLGIPSAIGLSDPIAYGFLDTSLSPKIQNAYHAVAIDEKRAQFPPTLWTSQPAPGQTLHLLPSVFRLALDLLGHPITELRDDRSRILRLIHPPADVYL